MSKIHTPGTKDLNTNLSAAESSTSKTVAKKAHSIIDEAAVKAEEIEKSLREKASNTQAKLGEKKAVATQQAEDTLAKLEHFIKDKPLASAGLAFGAGILLSRILRS